MKNQLLAFLAVIIVLTAFSINAGNASLLQSSVTLQCSGAVQQTQAGTYSYIITVSGSNYQMTDGATGHVYYQSKIASQVVNDAIGNLTQGSSILFSSGTYNLSGSITGTNQNNITLTFDSGATLFVENGMNDPAIYLSNANNWLISGVTINGNAANQVVTTGGIGPQGIEINAGSNDLVEGAYIYNCRQFGFYALGAGVTNDGITNSKLTFDDWNGVQLGADKGEQFLYAIHNEVAYCSDVGITNAGYSDIVQNNYVHDMNGTLGFNNANWGIAVEAGGNDTITGNTIINCPSGIVTSPTSPNPDSNLISANTIENSVGVGVQLISDYNILSNNQILKWDSGNAYHNAITIQGSNNEISNNTLNSTYLNGLGIVVVTGNNNQIIGNGITTPTSNGYIGIYVETGCTNTVIHQNSISGFGGGGASGILVGSGSVDTLIQNNNLTLCTGKKISDSGTATSLYTNAGYNPVGYIASPISGSTANLVDSGSNSTWISGKVYTNTESPKVLNISAGTVSDVAQNGVTLFTTTNCTVTLQPGDTFSITFSRTPTINVSGQ